MKTIYFHIGCEKTGTTSIQHFLAKNRNKLAEQGIAYPLLGHHKFAQLNLPASIDFRVKGNQPVDYYPGKNLDADHEWDVFLNFCRTTECASIVISAEHFSSRLNKAGIEFIQAKLELLGAQFSWKFVIFIRRQDWFLGSSYSTAIKAGSTQSFDEFFPIHLAARGRYDFDLLLSNWADVFSDENMLVKDYDAVDSGNLLDVFCATIGAQKHLLVEQQTRENRAWDPDMLEFVRLANTPKIKQTLGANRLAFLEQVNNLQHHDQVSKHTLISPAQRNQVLNAYSESNKKVAARFFPEHALFAHAKDASHYQHSEASKLNKLDILSLFAQYFNLNT
jgi:hypothetical protein